MATYDLSDLIGARTGFGLAKAHFEKILCGHVLTSSAGAASTASGSLSTLISLTTTGVVTTDLLVAVAEFNFSSGTASRRAVFQLQFNGTTENNRYFEVTESATDGRSVQGNILRFATDLSGSVTVDLKYAYSGTSTTIYAGYRSIQIFRFKSGGTLP